MFKRTVVRGCQGRGEEGKTSGSKRDSDMAQFARQRRGDRLSLSCCRWDGEVTAAAAAASEASEAKGLGLYRSEQRDCRLTERHRESAVSHRRHPQLPKLPHLTLCRWCFIFISVPHATPCKRFRAACCTGGGRFSKIPKFFLSIA